MTLRLAIELCAAYWVGVAAVLWENDAAQTMIGMGGFVATVVTLAALVARGMGWF